jgi:hypothetical protein
LGCGLVPALRGRSLRGFSSVEAELPERST